MHFMFIVYDLAGVEVFFNLGSHVLEILQAPCYLNPALVGPQKK